MGGSLTAGVASGYPQNGACEVKGELSQCEGAPDSIALCRRVSMERKVGEWTSHAADGRQIRFAQYQEMVDATTHDGRGASAGFRSGPYRVAALG